MLSRRAVLSAVAAIPLATSHTTRAVAAAITRPPSNLYTDNRYDNGFNLMPVVPSDTPRQVLDFGRPGYAPRWRLDEWWTKHSIADTPVRYYRRGSVPGMPFAGVGYESPGKRVIRATNGELWLQAIGSAEHDRPRLAGEPWPHLLIEQKWGSAGPRLVDLEQVRLNLRVRIDHIVNQMDAGDYDPALHAAQVSAFFSLQNLNQSSADYGSYVWFGVPIVDSRHDIPPAFLAEDAGHTGQTNQFIALMPGTEFWRSTVKDGRWHAVDTDLLPLMRRAFAIAQERGYLPVSHLDDLRITTSNVGWELPGTFDVAMQVAPLTALVLE